MPLYNWYGIDHQGKKIGGTEQAKNSTQLKTSLHNQGIINLEIKFNLASIITLHYKIKTKHIAHLIEQLTILINANTPIVKAFSIMVKDELNPNVKKLIISCKNLLTEGQSLAQTCQQHAQYFTPLICSVINAGEQSGTLDSMLNELTSHLKKIKLRSEKS